MEAITCRGLCKTYGATRALDGVSFSCSVGKIIALLGPNGSGKTTTVRILSTLTAADAGTAFVAGINVFRDASRVREVIGLTAQETVVDKRITGKEYLSLIASLRHIPRAQHAEEIAAVIAELDLGSFVDSLVETYSTGMRRRLDIAASLIGNPSVLFLDEPSNGLDPQSRQRLWETVRSRANDGTTILLTTQYMEEADALAHSIVVLANGRVIATGTPADLKDAIGARIAEITLPQTGDTVKASSVLARKGIVCQLGESSEMLQIPMAPSGPSLVSLVRTLDSEGLEVSDLLVRRPTLDEAFLHLTSNVASSPKTVII
jgi:ABC-type multidrug transport system ATPase subunit